MKPTMACTANEALISAHLDGELAPEDERALEAHLQACGRCAEELERARWLVPRLTADLRLLMDGAPVGAAVPELSARGGSPLSQRVVALVGQVGSVAQVGLRLAALVMLVAAMALLLRTQQQVSPALQATPAAGAAPVASASPAPVLVPAQPVPSQAVGPSVNTAAFRGQGKLAFVWRDHLYVLDGDRGTIRGVPDADHAAYPAWSPDGEWLAYLRLTDAQNWRGSLWLVRSDGSQAHEVQGLPAPVTVSAPSSLVQGFAWSPTADLLAVATPPVPSTVAGLWLVSPTGSAQPIAAVSSPVASFAWSPDGQELAYSSILPRNGPGGLTDAVSTVRLSGGGSAVQRFVGRPDEGIVLAGWWPDGRGLVFWSDPMRSGSIASDGLPLESLALDTGETHTLATTLPFREWISWSPQGQQLALVQGGGRQVWHNKAVAVCDAERGGCRALPRQPGMVSLDPAWSPDGRRVAYVQVADRGDVYGWVTCSTREPCSDRAAQDEIGARTRAAWLQTRTVWLADPTGSQAQELTWAGTGVYVPAWSRDGTRLLYVRDEGVWLVNVDGGSPVQILGGLTGRYSPWGYYGQVTWAAALAWHP